MLSNAMYVAKLDRRIYAVTASKGNTLWAFFVPFVSVAYALLLFSFVGLGLSMLCGPGLELYACIAFFLASLSSVATTC